APLRGRHRRGGAGRARPRACRRRPRAARPRARPAGRLLPHDRARPARLMRAFRALLAKDLRLLWRDRVGLTFLALAPLAVITVAGLSLANLYGADPTGQTAYELPLADEDGGSLGQEIRDRLGPQAAEGLPGGA